MEFEDVFSPIFSTIGKSILLMNGKFCGLIVNLILIDDNFVLSKVVVISYFESRINLIFSEVE